MTDTFRFDEKAHVYFLNDKPLHGVTTVLGVISKPALIQWAANEAIDYIEKFGTIHWSNTKDQVKEGYSASNALLKEARTAHRKKKEAAADAGTDLHAQIEEFVRYIIKEWGGRVPLIVAGRHSIMPFINWAREEKILFLEAEKRLYSEKLWVAGTCDLVFQKDGKTYIGDIKTYKKLWDRVPMLQCAGYGLMWKDMTGKDVDGYCVMRIKDGEFEPTWSFDVAGDTEGFLAALSLYKALKNWGVAEI